MFGIFDKPRTAIRKRIPVSALLEFKAVETLAEMRLKDEAIDGFQREAAIGFVLSVWACNSASAGKFGLSGNRYIQNLGLNYGGCLQRQTHDAAHSVILELGGRGVISLPPSAWLNLGPFGDDGRFFAAS